jgi:AcrR family transcriptional regulator
MTARRRLQPAERRSHLLEVAAQLFAARPYDDVLMEDVAAQAGISRALLYRHFASKRDLFTAVYQNAAQNLLRVTEMNPAVPFVDQLSAGLDAHIDYFVENRNTVLAANRALAGDPAIQAIITDELAVLRRRLVEVTGLDGRSRDILSMVLASWLVFVRVLCVDWLTEPAFTRTELRDICVGSLLGSLHDIIDLDTTA